MCYSRFHNSKVRLNVFCGAYWSTAFSPTLEADYFNPPSLSLSLSPSPRSPFFNRR